MLDQANPFCDAVALENSNYSAYAGGHLIHPDTGARPTPLTEFVHDALRALVLNEQFTCVGGKAAVRQGSYRFGLYGALGSADAAAGVAHDLFSFVNELASMGSVFTTYLASFAGPHPADEAAFERLLWRTLQQLHDLDAPHHAWDTSVSADAADPAFSFSFAGTAFFVVGLHAASSRATRRFAWPTLVFNPHRQFEQLKDTGRFARFQEIIRRGERALQGEINPMLSDYGERSEASQYSGRQVEQGWKCPFHAHGGPRSPRTDKG
jgi:FPC/CPF motif-containing protein YcgG